MTEMARTVFVSVILCWYINGSKTARKRSTAMPGKEIWRRAVKLSNYPFNIFKTEKSNSNKLIWL